MIRRYEVVKCNRSTSFDTIELPLDECRKCSNYEGEVSSTASGEPIPKHRLVSCNLPYKVVLSSSRAYNKRRFPVIKSKFICDSCGRTFGFHTSQRSLERHEHTCRALIEKKQLDNRREKEKQYDLKLLVTSGVPSYRKCLAIYRLYRNGNMTPKQLALHSSCSEGKIRDIIAYVFAELCKKDTKCVFREYFGVPANTNNPSFFPC
jgi:hypothetical protein